MRYHQDVWKRLQKTNRRHIWTAFATNFAGPGTLYLIIAAKASVQWRAPGFWQVQSFFIIQFFCWQADKWFAMRFQSRWSVLWASSAVTGSTSPSFQNTILCYAAWANRHAPRCQLLWRFWNAAGEGGPISCLTQFLERRSIFVESEFDLSDACGNCSIHVIS